jgi:hypothetical protein
MSIKSAGVIKVFLKAVEEGDLCVFIGDQLCKEANKYDRYGNLYLRDCYNSISVGLGIALSNNKRVFIFCYDDYALYNIQDLIQVSLSKNSNIYVVILFSGEYSNIGKYPTLLDSIASIHGVLFNIGFVVHDYTRHFDNTSYLHKELRDIWERMLGPMSIIVKIENFIKRDLDDIKDEIFYIDRTMKFLMDDSIKSFVYENPIKIDGPLHKDGGND